jgi:hypothetical protein
VIRRRRGDPHGGQDEPFPLFLGQRDYRRVRASNFKTQLREKLDTPIKQYRYTDQTKWSSTKREINIRIEAAFAFFGIPEEWPESLQWQQLAMHLLGAHFKGCRTFAKSVGGAPAVAPEEYQKLASDFDRFAQSKPPSSKRSELARWYLKKNKNNEVRIGREKITSWRALLAAVRRGKADGKKSEF